MATPPDPTVPPGSADVILPLPLSEQPQVNPLDEAPAEETGPPQV